MATNFKPYDDFYNLIDEQIKGKIRTTKPRQFKLATVVSIQTNTATILFDGDTSNVSGVKIQSGLTIAPSDRVKVQNVNMSLQLESFTITDKY